MLTDIAQVHRRVFTLVRQGRTVGYVYLDVRHVPDPNATTPARAIEWIVGGDPDVLDIEWADGLIGIDEEDRAEDFQNGIWDVYGVRCELRELPADVEDELRRDYFGVR
jgi:hypothetical protein